MCDMREEKQLNEQIMKICKLVIDNLEEQEIDSLLIYLIGSRGICDH
jgi:hypothetical protein